MPRYSVVVAPSAEEDIRATVDFIIEHASITAALRWYEEFVKKTGTLREFPERCPIAEESEFFGEEIRILIVGLYRVLYRIIGDVVQVLHVRHGARQREVRE